MKRVLPILFLVVVVLSGCVGGGYDEYYYISGSVYEKETNKPISNIVVLVESTGITDKTGPTGEFKLLKGRDSYTITPISSGWTFEPKSYLVTRERHDLDFLATPVARVPVYEDEYIKIAFMGCEPSIYPSVEAFLVFEMVNKTEREISFLTPTFALDGINLRNVMMFDDLSAKSFGPVRVASFDPLPTMKPTRVTGAVKMIDGVSYETLANISFVDIPVVH